MSPATRKLRSGATYSACTQDKSRVTKRKSSASKAPLITPERISTRKFRWTEKRDRSLLIHLIGLDGTISDNEYAKLAMLWDGATADDVHARVESLRAQQVLTIRTEEPAATAAATFMVAEDAAPTSTTDDNKPATNEDDISSDVSSPLSSPPSSLHSPTPTPSPPSSPHLTSPACDENEDDDDEDDDDIVSATPAPQLKSALKSRTTTGPGKAVRFPAVIATVRAYPPRPNHDLNKKRRDFFWPTDRPRHWVPTANAKWEDEMFDAADNHPETPPSSPAEGSSSKRTHDDFSADSSPSPSDDTVPRGRPTKRVRASASPSVARTRSASRLTASHRHHRTTPTGLPRRFNNHLSGFPKPVRAVAAVCASEAWLDESDDEEETRRVRKKRRYELRDGEVGFDHRERGWIDWAGKGEGEGEGEVETVVADEGWFDEGERDKGGVWAWEEEEEEEGGKGEEGEGEGEKEDAPVATPTQPVDGTCGSVFDEVDDIEQFERDCDEELGWDPSEEVSNSAGDNDSEEWGQEEEE